MSHTIFRNLLMIVCATASFTCKSVVQTKPTIYKTILQELNLQKVNTDAQKDIFIVLLSNADCAHCNIVISNVLSTPAIMDRFAKTNVCVIMPYIREVERPIYNNNTSLKIGDHKIPVIFNQTLYDSLGNSLTNAISGFIVINKEDKVKVHIAVSENDVYKKIMAGI